LPVIWLQGWEWTGFQRVTTGWRLSTKKWRDLTVKKEVDQSHLNRRWGCNLSRPDWTKFWVDLWKGKAHQPTKFVTWQMVQNGFFTNTQGALWGVCTELCPICSRAPETTAHLFFECEEVRHRWIKTIRLLRASKISFGRVASAFDITTTAVHKHNRNPALLVLVAELGWSAWVERNLRVFQGNFCRVPLQVVFRNCAVKLEALEGSTGSTARIASLCENRLFLLRCAELMRSVTTVM
jgi:hypothetical protein